MARTSTWSSSAKLGRVRRCAILCRNGCRCVWCGVDLTRETAQIDHVVPRRHRRDRSADLASNLVACCPLCNVFRPEEIELDPGMLAAPLRLDDGRRLAMRWYPTFAERERKAHARGRKSEARAREAREQAVLDGLGGAAFPFGCAGTGATRPAPAPALPAPPPRRPGDPLRRPPPGQATRPAPA